MAIEAYRTTRTNTVYVGEQIRDGVLFIDKLADGEEITAITEITISDETIVTMVADTSEIATVFKASDTVRAFFTAVAAGNALITFEVTTNVANHKPVGYIKWTVKTPE